MTKWTNDQLRAINDEGDILVSAGAGSGKTAVLTERIVRLVREGAGIKSILCVTFTVAAANEMKKRISRALFAAAADAPDEESASRLNAEARAAESASISTIHSFCTQVLRRHFNEAGLDPAFRVADDSEISLMRDEVFEELCETRLSDPDGAFPSLMQAMGSEKETFGAISSLYDFCRAQADPERFLRFAAQKYDVSADTLASSDETLFLLAQSRRRISAAAARLQAARDALAKDAPNSAAFLDEELLHARGALICETPDALREALSAPPHAAGRKMTWRGVVAPLRARAEKARDALKKLIAREANNVWREDMESEAALIRAQKPLIDELCSAVMDFDARFSAKKRAKNVIDYGDMEHMTLSLFGSEATAAEYRRRFKFIFMDEYQDCNGVQEEIIRAVANPGGLFLVGDVKQSIYRFRLAEPALFIRRSVDYAKGLGGERIDLRENFRSAPGVIDAVNGVFSRIMTADAAELDYDDRARLIHAREEAQGEDAPGEARTELLVCDMLAEPEEGGTDEAFEDADESSSAGDDDAGDADEGCDDDDEGEALPRTLVHTEAVIAARRIRALMETETVPDETDGLSRKLRYSDFAILLRAYRSCAEEWLSTLSACGIPAYGELAGGYFEAVEVRIFIELLRIIDNRTLNIPMAAVLRSPIGGFTTEELIELKSAYAPSDKNAADEDGWQLYDSLALASGEDTPLGEKARGFIEKLDRYQREASLMSVQSLIGALTDETDYALFLKALPGGRQREANLDALCEKARVFESTGARGLGAFLQYTDRLRRAGAEGAPQTAGANVVRVMSIHASKGLEFPVVIIGGLVKNFNNNIIREKTVMERDTGVAVRFNMEGVRTQSLYARAITALCLKKDLAEEMRVLYVAMTRARERLILIAAAQNGDALVSSAADGTCAHDVASYHSFAQWILACVLRSKEGAALAQRYGLNTASDAESALPIKTELILGPADDGASGRMSEAAYARFRREAALVEADTAIFERKYAFASDTSLASKVSVTGLAGHEIRMSEAPDFLLEERMSAADRGTAFHALMQRITLAPHTEESVRGEAARLCAAGFLSPAQEKAVDAKKVAAFFTSDIGKRLVAAESVRRELEFNLALPARELGVADNDADVILQGVIDCCFVENGSWVLIDYKTDAVPDGVTPAEAAAKHARQVELYSRALERLTGRNVSEKYIYLFTLGTAVPTGGDGSWRS